MVLIKPSEACSTAEVYRRLRLDQTSKVDPLTLLDRISWEGISQDVCINDLEYPAFEVLPSLRRLRQLVIAANRGQYDAVFMSGSGSTSVGIGSPDPPQCIYDEEEYTDVFLSGLFFNILSAVLPLTLRVECYNQAEANFITREEGSWYSEPVSSSSQGPLSEFSRPLDDGITQA